MVDQKKSKKLLLKNPKYIAGFEAATSVFAPEIDRLKKELADLEALTQEIIHEADGNAEKLDNIRRFIDV